jgi:hypothetical protein
VLGGDAVDRIWDVRLQGRAGIAGAVYVTAVDKRVVIVRARRSTESA